MQIFSKPFTQQEPLSERAIASAVAVMRTGRLHRYNTIEGEVSQTALLEKEFAQYMGAQYCLACASGGYAIHIALKAAGMTKGDRVMCNAFTLSPVPGAIDNAGGTTVLVEINDAYKIDIEDLKAKALSSGARFLLLSHMRGHISDMDAVMEICDEHDILLIEDCAHTLGARWKGKLSGSFGHISCFSSQTYKHLNSGEGGLMITNDQDAIARAVLYSGSYMLYGSHLAVPDDKVFDQYRLVTPNYSGRMDNLRASILRVQLHELEDNCRRWNLLYGTIAKGLRTIAGITLPRRPQHEEYVGSSIQFSLPDRTPEKVKEFVGACAMRGVEIKWFGDPVPHAFTSRYDSWHYIKQRQNLSETRKILDSLCDLRVPLTFDEADCGQIVAVIEEAISQVSALSTGS